MTHLINRRLLLASTLGMLIAVGCSGGGQADAGSEAAEKDTSTLIGQMAPDFTLKTLDGKEVKLSDYRGKPVLIDFWATWCPPCVKGLPHIGAIAANDVLTKKGLVVLAVNAAEQPETVQNFLNAKGLNHLTVPLDAENKVMSDYLVSGIPTTVLIDRDGKIATAFVGLAPEAELDSAVQRVVSGS